MSVQILIVDDSWYVRTGLPKAFIRHFPHVVVHTAATAIEALEKIDTTCYHIVMLDGRLQDLATPASEDAYGYYLAPVVRSRYPLAEIIMISGDDESNQRGIQMGADRILSKDILFSQGVLTHSITRQFTAEEGV